MDKTLSMKEAVGRYVEDGMTVALEGFSHLIPFAAAHEIIRQGRKDLTLCRMTPDIVSDQLVAAGCVRKLVASFFASGSAGSLYELRRRIENQDRSPSKSRNTAITAWCAGIRRERPDFPSSRCGRTPVVIYPHSTHN